MGALDNRSRLFFNWNQELGQGASLSFVGPGILEILDALPFYVMLIDRNHRILLANRSTREQLGLEPQEIIGEFCPKVVHGIEAGTYPGCPLAESVEKNEPVERVHFDEEYQRWLRIAIYPTGSWTVDGQEIYFHMIMDITEQKQTIEKLQDDREKYRLLLEEIIRQR